RRCSPVAADTIRRAIGWRCSRGRIICHERDASQRTPHHRYQLGAGPADEPPARGLDLSRATVLSSAVRGSRGRRRRPADRGQRPIAVTPARVLIVQPQFAADATKTRLLVAECLALGYLASALRQAEIAVDPLDAHLLGLTTAACVDVAER